MASVGETTRGEDPFLYRNSIQFNNGNGPYSITADRPVPTALGLAFHLDEAFVFDDTRQVEVSITPTAVGRIDAHPFTLTDANGDSCALTITAIASQPLTDVGVLDAPQTEGWVFEDAKALYTATADQSALFEWGKDIWSDTGRAGRYAIRLTGTATSEFYGLDLASFQPLGGGEVESWRVLSWASNGASPEDVRDHETVVMRSGLYGEATPAGDYVATFVARTTNGLAYSRPITVRIPADGQAPKDPTPDTSVKWTWAADQVCITTCNANGVCDARQVQTCEGGGCPAPRRSCYQVAAQGSAYSVAPGTPATSCYAEYLAPYERPSCYR